EVTVAGESHKVVIPFRIENAEPKHGLRVRLSDLHWLDAFVSRERAIDELVRTLPAASDAVTADAVAEQPAPTPVIARPDGGRRLARTPAWAAIAVGLIALVALGGLGLWLARTSIFGPAPLSADREQALKPGDTFNECAGCPQMVVAPAGSFMMGSPDSEPQRSATEGPQHQVTIARNFAVGQFEVSFDEWDACVAGGGCNGYKPDDAGWGRGRQPVIYVSWDDANAYVAWLAKMTGRPYRLLSEAELEYVTRAGTTTPFWWGDSITTSQANYDGTPYVDGQATGEYRRRTVPVDTFSPNAWKLYQAHGNVYVWAADCWNQDYQGAPGDGSPWASGDCSGHAIRGGSWDYDGKNLRSASRLGYPTATRANWLGLRVARTLASH
ncbi:MAG TPA: formylglycine-generating enzyme family protein, partial [Caulobacteraceae bacterium]|nr:formylglycine-generating enzyme family protein [Caulobacteraceae bacterium]